MDGNYLEENNNSIEGHESIQNGSNITSLQKDLIEQISNPNVTKIRGAPSKKRIKSAIETSKKRVPMQEVNDNQAVIKQQRKCLLCGKPGHYQKKCPSARE